MLALLVSGKGAEASITLSEAPKPKLSYGEVSIKVSAAGVNRADLAQKAGNYPPPAGASEILGLEVAGVIEEVAPDLSKDWIGKRVCSLLTGGGYAEFAVAPASMLFELPETWDFDYGAAIPEAFITAYTNLFFEGGLTKGESVLIHGGASGVGTAAIQLAKVAGASVYVTAGNAEKCAKCIGLGADVAINYSQEDFVKVVSEKSGTAGMDLILDIVGGSYLERNLQVIGKMGRIVNISYLEGRMGNLDIGRLMAKRARVIGSVLRSRSLKEKEKLFDEFVSRFGKELLSGKIKPILDKCYDWREAELAHQRMSHSSHFGKVILKITN